MNEPLDVMIVEAARGTVAVQIARYGVGLLRGITFTALLIIYVVWVLTISAQFWVGPGTDIGVFTSALVGLAFLISLPALGHLCTVQDKGGNFAAPSAMVVLLFISYGLLTGYILLWGLAFAGTATTLSMVAQGVGTLSPLLAVALTMLLAGIARSSLVWELEPKRLKATKYWLYFAPPSFFLICQVLHIVGRLAG